MRRLLIAGFGNFAWHEFLRPLAKGGSLSQAMADISADEARGDRSVKRDNDTDNRSLLTAYRSRFHG